MLVETKAMMTPPQPPICPNCGADMYLAEPDEFFKTYAYYCDECGIRTKECDTPDEAYATIRHRSLNNEGRAAKCDV